MRRRRGASRHLWEEAADALILTEAGALLGARHTARTYARLVELAEELGVPAPPPVEHLVLRGAGDAWARSVGLLHPLGACRSDRGEHWAFACRG